MPAPKPQTISNIATELGEDSARIRKLVQALGIRPTGKNAHNADLYRMSKAQKGKAQGGEQGSGARRDAARTRP
jgi:hypothetical protein